MQRAKIVIASVLKPIKDPRAYYKMALSLRETSKYDLNIIGFSIKKEIDEDNVKFTPLNYNKRNPLNRFAASSQFFNELLRYKPDVVLVTTYELLPAALLAKALMKFKLVYDVQENYSLNLKHNHTQRGIKKSVGITIIKAAEALAKPAIDLFIFAEKCYVNEFPNWKPSLILENKFAFPESITNRLPQKSSLKKFILTGTLTPAFGSLDGIRWFLKFNQCYPSTHLKIIGHVPMVEFKKILEKTIGNHESISYELSDLPIPYSRIIEAISSSDILLLPYQQLPSIAPKIPSKLYEGCALGKIIFHSPNHNWQRIVTRHGDGMEIDFLNGENIEEAHNFLNLNHSNTKPASPQVFWNSISHDFMNAIAKLIK